MDDSGADYLVLGGGTAGSVLASRLSQRADTRVILIEAGRDIGPEDLPGDIASGYPGTAFLRPQNTWPGLRARLGTEAEMPYDQPRLLGGGSSINAMLANRGAPADYDAWGALGAEGWSWQSVAPVFRRLETDLDFADSPDHGSSGPIHVRRRGRQSWSAFARAAAQAAEAAGYAQLDDQNGPWRDGVFAIATSRDRAGQRETLARTYLSATVRARPGLRILTGHRALRLIWQEGRIAGAEVLGPDGTLRTILAQHTILACGALFTPAILMRSGIGPGADLQALGIEVRRDLPGVGANLMEHPALGLAAYLPPGARMRGAADHHIHAGMRFTSDGGRHGPGDMHMSFVGRAAWHDLGARLGLLYFWINAPSSRGRLRLASADPMGLPSVDFGLLSHPDDLARMGDAFRLAARMMASPGLSDLARAPLAVRMSPAIRALMRPGRGNAVKAAAMGIGLDLLPAGLRQAVLTRAVSQGLSVAALLQDDTALEQYLRGAVAGVWHPSGTCRMGRAEDRGAVTNGHGVVHGVAGLRVCDASLFPVIPRANTNLPVAMVAERIAEAVLTGG